MTVGEFQEKIYNHCYFVETYVSCKDGDIIAFRKEWKEKEEELKKEFKQDLFEAYDALDNPKAEKTYTVACEDGIDLWEISFFFNRYIEMTRD